MRIQENKKNKTLNKLNTRNIGVIVVLVWSMIVTIFSTKSSIINTLLYSVTMIPLAILLGKTTSKLSTYVGEKRGGLISATAGNVPELMMSLWSIKYGMESMAKAGLLGSVIANMLLGLGIAVFCGGIRYREQKFNKILARTNMNMLFLVMVTVIIISALNKYSFVGNGTFLKLSLVVSVVLILVYILGLVFSLYTHSNLFLVGSNEGEKKEINKKELRETFFIMIIITIVLYFISEGLVSNISDIIVNYKISQEFLGIILIPLLGSFGEAASSIVCALDNKVDVSLETAIGSSIQITMFVLPTITIFSYLIGMPITLLFSSFQIIIMAISLAMAYLVFQDGKTYWFEGALLIAVYVIVTISYYYVV